MLITTLKQIGLEEKHAKIYLACLELGKTSIKDIAKKSGIKRTTIYDIIDDMINAGYIKITTKGKRKKFVAIEPNKLKTLLKKREVLLNQILPDLQLINNVNRTKPKIWFYEGVEGLKKVYEDTLGIENSIFYGWASEDVVGVLGEKWVNEYLNKRKTKKIRSKIIMTATEKIKEIAKHDKEQLRKSKLIDPKKYPFEIEINIYNNRVALISSIDKMAVIIESDSTSNTMKTIFDLCWNNL